MSKKTSTSLVPSRNIILLLLFIILVHIVILSRITFFPYPEIFIYTYLTKQGLLPYAQILDQHFPGLLFFPVNFATLGIDTVPEMQLVHWGTVALVHVLLFQIGKKITGSSRKAILTNILYLLWQPFFEGYVYWIDIMVIPFILGSLLFLLDSDMVLTRKSIRLFCVGLLMGLALVFKQVVLPLGIFVGLYVWYSSKSVKLFFYYVLGASIAPFLMNLYFYSIGIWEDFFYWTYTFNVGTFAEMGRKFVTKGEILRIMPVFGTAFLVLFVRKITNFGLLVGVTIGTCVFAYARFDYVHLQPALVWILLLTTIVFTSINNRIVFILGLLYVLSAFVVLRGFYTVHWGNESPFFGPFEERLVEKVQDYSEPGDSIFAFGTTPHLYYLTDTLPSGDIFVFQFPWFMVETEERILTGIKHDPPQVVVKDPHATTAGMNLVSYMPHIENYIDEHYRVADEIGDVEILVPKEEEKSGE